MSNPSSSKRSSGPTGRSLKPYSALRGVSSSKIELPKDDERTTMITDAIMDEDFDLSQLRHKDDCEFVQIHRPMYAEWVGKVKNEQGKEELDSNAVTQLRKTLHDTVAANFVGPATQARSLSSLIFTSYQDKQTSLPVNCHIGDSPAPNQWPPRSAEFFAAMSCKYRLTLATMTDAQRASVANEIQATSTDFVGNPDSTMRGLGRGSRAL